MDKLVYISEGFNKQEALGCTLLIGVGQPTDMFAVIDSHSGLKFLATGHPDGEPAEVKDLLTYEFGEVKIMAQDLGYSFIPDEVYDAASLPVYQRFLPVEETAAPTVSRIASQDIRLISRLNRLGLERYTAKFPEAAVYPRIYAYLRGIEQLVAESAHVLAIDKTTGSIVNICYFHGGKMHYCNDFEIHSPTDLHYYLLTLVGHLGVEGQQLMLVLSGDFTAGDSYSACLAGFGKTTIWANIAAPVGLSLPADLPLEQHSCFSLFALQLCG